MSNIAQNKGSEMANTSSIGPKPLIPLSRKHVEHLVSQYQKGKQTNASDIERVTSTLAWRRLLTVMQPFVANIVTKYAAGRATPDQLIQAGNRGLKRAMRAFDPAKQPKFSSCVIGFIRAEINKMPSSKSKVD